MRLPETDAVLPRINIQVPCETQSRVGNQYLITPRQGCHAVEEDGIPDGCRFLDPRRWCTGRLKLDDPSRKGPRYADSVGAEVATEHDELVRLHLGDPGEAVDIKGVQELRTSMRMLRVLHGVE